MTKFFITRFRYVTRNGEQVKKWETLPCRTNLLPSHKALK